MICEQSISGSCFGVTDFLVDDPILAFDGGIRGTEILKRDIV